MTQLPPNDESSISLLAPLARGLMRRAPEILALSIHDAAGHALWASSDFLLVEDHALIAEVVEDPHDVRGQSSGLWWESADTARARCALALFDEGQFSGVLLAVFSGLTTRESDRDERFTALRPALPVLARAARSYSAAALELIPMLPPSTDETIIAALRFASADGQDELAADLATLAREEKLLGLIDVALRE